MENSDNFYVKDAYSKYAFSFVTSDYLTLTSRDAKMPLWFAEVANSSAPFFEVEGIFNWGGTPYSGTHYYLGTESKFFIGSRESLEGFLSTNLEYIINIPGLLSEEKVIEKKIDF